MVTFVRRVVHNVYYMCSETVQCNVVLRCRTRSSRLYVLVFYTKRYVFRIIRVSEKPRPTEYERKIISKTSRKVECPRFLTPTRRRPTRLYLNTKFRQSSMAFLQCHSTYIIRIIQFLFFFLNYVFIVKPVFT